MFKQQLPHTVLLKTLEWSYMLAIRGFRGFSSAEELAKYYRCKNGGVENQMDCLIRRQRVNAGISGLVTGLGGAFSLPVGMPANVASVLLFQVRMVAAIACLQQRDLSNQGTKVLVFACLTGNHTKNVLSELGVNGSLLLLGYSIRKIPDKWMKILYQRISAVLLKNIGACGAARLTRILPFVSGVAGAAMDSFSTQSIGYAAKELFSDAGSPQEKEISRSPVY